MNSEALFALLGDMDDEYITAAEQPVNKVIPWKVIAPVAACAVLAIVAIPLLRGGLQSEAPLHSYVVGGAGTGMTMDAVAGGTVTAAGGGDYSYAAEEAPGAEHAVPALSDEDQLMTADEVRQAMLESGFTQDEAAEFLALGYDMTWVQWWKFHDSYDAGERTVDALTEHLESFNHHTGEIIGGALAPDPTIPADAAAIEAYQQLLAHFDAECGPGKYPDWYGGAYVVNGNFLIVNIVNSYDETLTDKNFYFEIMDWCGSTNVGFGGSKYSLNELRALQQQITALPELAALESWGCGVDETDGVVTLDVPTADKALLKALAKLDPADDAIVVNVGQIINTDTAVD